MGEAVFEGTRKSITRRQNTFAHYIATQPILDLCEWATRQPGARVSLRCWEHASINLDRAKKRVSESAIVLELESDSEFNVDPGKKEELRGATGSSAADWRGV